MSNLYGTMQDGTPVTAHALEAEGIRLSILTYGGLIRSLEVPDRDGRPANVTLGLNSLEEYVAHSPYFGALVGRFANRIAGGRFTLDGRQYQLPVNNGPNSLHGGLIGLSHRVWMVAEHTPAPLTLS